ncbi:hypothetical protein [Roseivirga seohaensis]|uniref:hypothetical protein n=1 Tax=Roseivirga seohaensis TaxID=1914963 RepID=UPI003BA925BA
MAGFTGYTSSSTKRTPRKQQVGFAGFTTYLIGRTPVMVQDSLGRGIPGVTVYAENPISGNSKSVQTDAFGNAQIKLDAETTVTASIWALRETVTFTTAPNLIITLRTHIPFE